MLSTSALTDLSRQANGALEISYHWAEYSNKVQYKDFISWGEGCGGIFADVRQLNINHILETKSSFS